MNVGDLAWFFDGHGDEAVPVIITQQYKESGLHQFFVLTEMGEQWVTSDDLITMEDWEVISAEV